MKKFFKRFFAAVLLIIVLGYLIPEREAMPCGSPADFNHNSFWTWPWTRGEAGHPHTGVDIFGKVGTPVVSQTGGIVLYSGYYNNTAGNAVFVLGPKWRLHEYLHLNTADAKLFHFVKPGEQIGTLGKTGNAAKTAPHVHYGIATPIPYVWKYFDNIGTDNQPARYDWMKMFFLDPADHLPKE